MAGLIGLNAHDMVIQDALGAVRWAYEGEWVPRPVVRPTTSIPVALKQHDERLIVRARWGFDVGKGRPIGNARDDRLRSSRMWSSMLGSSPCLVAATAVYEQVRRGKDKTNYWFRRRDGAPIVMPGLCQTRRVDDEERLCATIVTTEPNAFFAHYHDRQVCVLDGGEQEAWLTEADPEACLRLLHAPSNKAWEAVPVEGVFARGVVTEADIRQVGTPEVWGSQVRRPGQSVLDV